MVATGNPMSIAYTWTKDGQPILSSGKYDGARFHLRTNRGRLILSKFVSFLLLPLSSIPDVRGYTGVQRIVSEGPILNITKLTRNDAGIYTCEAVNSQGAAMINITVVVECK